jgi:IS605 OrfB family transposase
MRLDKRIYSKFDMHGISITSSERNRRERATFVLYPKVSEMFRNYTTSDPLLFIRDGVPYLSVSFNVPDKPVTDDMSVGVDLGERLLFVTSEGKAFRDKAYLRERRKIRFKKKQLQSKGTKLVKRKLKKLHRRECNLSNDMCQRACNALLQSTHASVFVLEDLKKLKQGTAKTKEGYKNKSHNRRLSQVPFYKFKEILTYKAQLVGKRVETVSAYNTSQTDCRTGKTDGERHKRRYIGADGVVLDADYNAAVNIAKRGRHPFSMNVPKDGTLDILKGRAQSTARMHRPERPGASPSL